MAKLSEDRNKNKRVLLVDDRRKAVCHLLVVAFDTHDNTQPAKNEKLKPYLQFIETHYTKGVSEVDVDSLRKRKSINRSTNGGYKRIGFVVEVDETTLYDLLLEADAKTSEGGHAEDKLISVVNTLVALDNMRVKTEKTRNKHIELRRKVLNPFEIKTVEKKKYFFLDKTYATEKEMNEAMKEFIKDNSGEVFSTVYVFDGREYSSLEVAENALSSLKMLTQRTGAKFITRLSKPTLKGSSLVYSAYDVIGNVTHNGVHVYRQYEKDGLCGTRGTDGLVVGTDFIPTEVYTLMHFEGDKLVTEHLDSFTFDNVTYV